VSLANHARTHCHDGLLRPRCYVAIAIDASTRKPLAAPLPAGGLAQAVLGSQTFERVGNLGALSVAKAWAPVTRAPPTGDFFRLRGNGIRCVRAPCFSIRVGRLNTATHTHLASVLELAGPAGIDAKTLRLAQRALATREGLLASGRVVATPDGGRSFDATQLYLRSATPRA